MEKKNGNRLTMAVSEEPLTRETIGMGGGLTTSCSGLVIGDGVLDGMGTTDPSCKQ